VSAHFPTPSTPMSGHFPVAPSTPISRSDSGFALQATLREKRSGHFDSSSRRSSSFGFDRMPPIRRPSQPFLNHMSTPSTSTLNSDFRATSSYAPSVYAHSTLAASTIMPGLQMAPVHVAGSQCVEGHVMQWTMDDDRSVCAVCDEGGNDGSGVMVRCNGCPLTTHTRCTDQISVVCPNAFRPDQVRAAFVRCFASLFYTYRRFLRFPDPEQRKNGMLYHFNTAGFLRSLPHECAEFMAVFEKTQCKCDVLG
jgi:hypothetical protein